MLNNRGQNMVEYTLIFISIVLVIFVAVGPNGFLRNAVSNSLNKSMVDGIDVMTNDIDLDRYK